MLNRIYKSKNVIYNGTTDDLLFDQTRFIILNAHIFVIQILSVFLFLLDNLDLIYLTYICLLLILPVPQVSTT